MGKVRSKNTDPGPVMTCGRQMLCTMHSSSQAYILCPLVTIFSITLYSYSSFHQESVSRSQSKPKVTTVNCSWVFICWLVCLVFVSSKISPDSKPWTRISVLVSGAVLAKPAKGSEENNSSFQSHCPQTVTSGDRTIAHTADC